MKKIIIALVFLFAGVTGCGYIKDKATEKINEKIDNTIDENMRLIDSIADNSMKNIDSLSQKTGISVDSLKAKIDSMSRITKEALKKNIK